MKSEKVETQSPYLKTFKGPQESIPSLAESNPQNRYLGLLDVYKYGHWFSLILQTGKLSKGKNTVSPGRISLLTNNQHRCSGRSQMAVIFCMGVLTNRLSSSSPGVSYENL
jgi:hypothetical protein